MSSIEDPLAKPTWPDVDPNIQEAVLNQLITLKSSGRASHVLVGFNSVMAALEDHFRGGPAVQSLYVARHDISSWESMPLSLASAAGRIRLVALPKGSKERLDGVSVMGTLSGCDEASLLESFVQAVGSAETSWSYIGANPGKATKKAKGKGAKNNKKQTANT